MAFLSLWHVLYSGNIPFSMSILPTNFCVYMYVCTIQPLYFFHPHFLHGIWNWKSVSCVWLFVTLWTVTSVHGTLQVRILESVTIFYSRGSSWPRDRTQVSHIAGRFFTSWATALQVALVVKSPPASAGDIRDTGSIPGLGRSPGGGNSNLLQYSCLGNPIDREAWWTVIHRVTKSWTWLKWLLF